MLTKFAFFDFDDTLIHGDSGGKTTSFGFYEKIDLQSIVEAVRERAGENAIIGIHGDFGVILVSNLAIGFITPPLGVNLFVASSVGNVKFERIVMAVIPFLFSMIICLIVITFVPSLSLWLPSFFK